MHWGRSPHKTESCVPRTEPSCYPGQTSQTLDSMPKRLISCHCQPRFNYSWTTSWKTTNQQSSKLKVASIVSDKRAILTEPSDVSGNPVTRDFAYHVAKWILRTVHIFVPKKGMKRELWNPPWLASDNATFQEGKDLLPGALFVLECWTHPSPPPLSLSLSQQSSHAVLPLLQHANSEPAAAKHLHHALADWSLESAGPS